MACSMSASSASMFSRIERSRSRLNVSVPTSAWCWSSDESSPRLASSDSAVRPSPAKSLRRLSSRSRSSSNRLRAVSASMGGHLTVARYARRQPGPLAHRVEQGTFNPKVQGSRPWRPTPNCPNRGLSVVGKELLGGGGGREPRVGGGSDHRDDMAQRLAAGPEGTSACGTRGDALLRHRDDVHAVARRILADAGLAEDVVQETLARALRHEETLEPERAGAWLTVVGRRLAFDTSRSRQRVDVVPDHDDRASVVDDPVELAERRHLLAQVAEALDDLTLRQRRLLLRQVDTGLSLAQLAEEEHTTVASVRSVLARAREVLRANLHHTGWLVAGLLPRLLTAVASVAPGWAGPPEVLRATPHHPGWLAAGLLPRPRTAVRGPATRLLPRIETPAPSLPQPRHDLAEVAAAGAAALALLLSTLGGSGAGGRVEAAATAGPMGPSAPPHPAPPEDMTVVATAGPGVALGVWPG